MKTLLSRSFFTTVVVLSLLLAAGSMARMEGPPHGNSENFGGAGEAYLSANAAAGGLITCGDSGQDTFNTTSGTFVVLRQCTLTVPAEGKVFISADATADYYDGDYEAHFDLNIDSTAASYDHDRWVAVNEVPPGGEDNTFGVSALQPVTAGIHTVYLMVRRNSGSGTVHIFDSSLSVMYIPSANTDVLTCGEYGNTTFTTTEPTYQAVRQCSLTAPTNGWAYITADATGGSRTGYWELLAGIGIDSKTTVDNAVDRRFDVDVHPTNGDTDATLSVAAVLPVMAGSHDFYFSVERTDGAGTVRLYDPALSVIYVPFGSLSLIPYSIAQNARWRTSSTVYEVIRQMPMMAASNGLAFISANAWVRGSDVCNGHFDIGVDSASGHSNHDRWVALYPDAKDLADKALAISAWVPVTAGMHTVYFVGAVYSGTCTISVYDSTLTILVLPGQVFLPLVLR